MEHFSRTSNSSLYLPSAQSTVGDIQLANDVAECFADPLGFVMMAYQWGEPGPLQNYPNGPDNWQSEFLIELGEQIAKRGFNGVDPVAPIRMTRASGHGIGKGVMTGFITDFLMSTRPNCKGTVTANSYPQLETKTWAAIQKWTKYCITAHWFVVTGNIMYRIGARENWFTAALSCAPENSQAFAGQHAADSTSFYIVDEGSNVPDEIYKVADGGLTDGEPMIFVWGNPTRSEGKFYNINFGPEKHRWLHKSIDARTCKFTNKDTLQEWLEDWGENSDRFRVQVRGLPPSASDTQFISSTLVYEAQRRKVKVLYNDPVICGLDIARGGNDNCVFRFRVGRDARSIPSIKLSGEEAKDSTVVENKALDVLKNGVLRIKEDGEFERLQIDMMFIDGTGVGGPVCDHLKALGFRDRITEIQFGSDAPNSKGFEECANMRTWMWMLTREFLKTGAVDVSTDLEADLTGPMYEYRTSDNRLQLEPKEKMKKRRGTTNYSGSPDEGDALALTFAMPVAPRKTEREAQDESEGGSNYDKFAPGRGRVWG